MSLEPGIHDGIPAELYHADLIRDDVPTLSSSIAKMLCLQTPLHAFRAHPKLNPAARNGESEAYDIGTAAHALLLEGDGSVYIIDAPDWRTKAAKETRDMARANGLTPMLAGKWNDVQEMVAQVRGQLSEYDDGAEKLFDPSGHSENTIVWLDNEFGVWCKARLDWWAERTEGYYIGDLKTVDDANPEKVTKSLFTNGYDIQCAFYLRGFRQVMEADAAFRFCFAERESPYTISVVSLGPDALMLAEKRVRYALETWKRCLDTNEWPGWPRRTCYATLPAWVESQWLEKEMMTEDGRKVRE